MDYGILEILKEILGVIFTFMIVSQIVFYICFMKRQEMRVIFLYSTFLLLFCLGVLLL